MNNYELLKKHVFVTKLAGFEHTKYIQDNETKQKVNENDIPLVQGKNIKNGRFVENFEWYISKNISDLLVRSKLNKKCILIPYVGSNLGEVGIFDNNYECHMASNIAKVELIDDYFDLDYLKYYFQSNIGQSYLFRSKQGSAQPNITMESIRNTLVIDYKKDRQKKIANTLKNIDDKIDNNNKIINESEKLAKKIYDYWFIQFEFPDKNGNPYKSSNGKMIYNEKLKKEIPENWKVGNLYDIADFINGLACQKYRPKKNELGLPVIKIREMNEGISSDTERVSSGINEKYIVNDNSILFSWSATLEVIRWYGGKAGLNQHIFKINPTKYGMNYTYQQLKSYINNFVKIALSRKTTMGHITTDHIKQSVIVLPPKSIVNRYEKMVSSLYDKLLLKSKENEELSKLKNFLLPLLMNGQVGFKD